MAVINYPLLMTFYFTLQNNIYNHWAIQKKNQIYLHYYLPLKVLQFPFHLKIHSKLQPLNIDSTPLGYIVIM